MNLGYVFLNGIGVSIYNLLSIPLQVWGTLLLKLVKCGSYTGPVSGKSMPLTDEIGK